MKFTSSGALGVVASSNDVNFQKPSSIKEYDETEQDGNIIRRVSLLIA